MASTLLLSCGASKWDGNNPPQQRKTTCMAMYGAAPIVPVVPSPFNEFWSVELQQNIPAQLTKGFGGDEDYIFDPGFVKRTFPNGAPRPVGVSGL